MTLYNSTFRNPGKPMKRSGFKQSAHKSDLKAGKKRLRSRQRPVTAEEKALWDRMAKEVGCIACRLDGVFNDWVSIHHIAGRTQEGCHKKVLPLCGSHHQDDGKAIAVHPDKARFERKYGNQYALLEMVMRLIGE